MKRWITVLFCLGQANLLADWPQWRGPDRNGVAESGEALPDTFPAEGLVPMWESEFIPSDHDGGHSSVVVADGKVFLNLVWHENIPSEKRIISDEVMGKFGHWRVGLPQEIIDKLEKERENLSPRMRGDKLDAFIDQWCEENLTEEQRVRSKGWVAGRFRKGASAVPLIWLDKLLDVSGKPFANQQAFLDWLEENGFPEDVKKLVVEAVPATEKKAQDVVLCLDAKTGKQLWKHAVPAEAVGRSASSTPAVKDGLVFSVGASAIRALRVESGEQVWEVASPGKGLATSPLVWEKQLIIAGEGLLALDSATGKELWRAKDVKTRDSSPVVWEWKGKPIFVCQAGGEIIGINAADGSQAWKIGGGGSSTPVVSGPWLVSFSSKDDLGLVGYKDEGGEAPVKQWNHHWLSSRYNSSPMIRDDRAYVFGGDKQLCVNLEDGRVIWEESATMTISSPLIVGDKILTMERNGAYLNMIKATGDSFQQLASVNIKAMWCPSPAYSDGVLFLRMSDKMAAFRIAP